ncbi:MAG: hypothetical protein PWP46_2072 [Fusobacteriaceae bacterium]|jgi:hypothetical protein|nr:hypothetical protein [Fusobacteriaceae bacterium]
MLRKLKKNKTKFKQKNLKKKLNRINFLKDSLF